MDNFIESLNEKANIEDMVQKRIDYLLQDSYQNKRKLVGESKSGFAKPDEKFELFADQGYVIDDQSIYIDLINEILQLKKTEPANDIKDLAVGAVKKCVVNYFKADCNKSDEKDYAKYIDKLYALFKGTKVEEKWKAQLDLAKNVYLQEGLQGVELNEKIELQAREWFPTYSELSGKTPNISLIKGLGIGKCVEHAALTNQLFNFLGIDSWFVVNSLVDENGHEGHAYNIREGSSEPVLNDFMNNISFRITEQKAKNVIYDNGAVYNKEKNVCYGNSLVAIKMFEENNLSREF